MLLHVDSTLAVPLPSDELFGKLAYSCK